VAIDILIFKKICDTCLSLKSAELSHFLAANDLATRRIPCVKMKLTFSVHFPYG